MTLSTFLKLSRVSNLPTVWTNSLTGVVLVGSSNEINEIVPIIIALSFFYVGGMFLNDAFDAEIDSIERPERPIPSGVISKMTVFSLGFSFLGIGFCLLAWHAYNLTGSATQRFAGGTRRSRSLATTTRFTFDS